MVKSPEAFLVNHATCRARATVIQACRNPVHKIRRTRSDSAGEVVVVEAVVVVVVVVGMAMERDDEGEGWRVVQAKVAMLWWWWSNGKGRQATAAAADDERRGVELSSGPVRQAAAKA